MLHEPIHEKIESYMNSTFAKSPTKKSRKRLVQKPQYEVILNNETLFPMTVVKKFLLDALKDESNRNRIFLTDSEGNPII